MSSEDVRVSDFWTFRVDLLAESPLYQQAPSSNHLNSLAKTEMHKSETVAADLAELTAEIVSAYVVRNPVPASDLPSLLHSVHGALGQILSGAPTEEPKTEELKPAVPIKKSITDDYLISLENGQKFKSLKRHLMTSYSMTPQQYREKWGLPKDYPMVAPAYAKSRSALAKSLGLGRKPAPAPLPIPAKAARKPARGSSVPSSAA